MKKGIIYIFITAFAFSTMEIVGKLISTQINPFQLTFIRFFIGSIFLLPFAIKDIRKRGLSLRLNDFAFFALTGIIGIVVSMSFFQLAILNTKASIVAVIFSTNSVFTMPFACLILKEKLTIKMVIALSISITGICFIFNPFSASTDIKGLILAFVAAITFSLYGVISKKRIHKYGGLILNCFSFLIGNMFLFIVLIMNKVPIINGINTSNIFHLIYLGIFVTGIGYLSYFEAMKHTSAITTSMVFFIKPAIAPVLSFIILKESLATNTIMGVVFIILGSFVMFLRWTSSDSFLKKLIVKRF